MAATLKAFICQEDDEGTGDVRFATHAITAHKSFSREFGDGDLRGTTCRRLPWADQYAPGPVPKLAMIDHGWWFECHGCQIKISEEILDPETDEVLDLVPVEYGSAIYCCEDCRTRHLEEQRQRKIAEAEAIADLSAKLMAAIPGVEIVTGTQGNWDPHAYVMKQKNGTWATQQCVVSFRFPGCKISFGTYRFDKIGEAPHVSVCNGDREAWDAWRASLKVDA